MRGGIYCSVRIGLHGVAPDRGGPLAPVPTRPGRSGGLVELVVAAAGRAHRCLLMALGRVILLVHVPARPRTIFLALEPPS
jgi:hypothetical protein